MRITFVSRFITVYEKDENEHIGENNEIVEATII